MKGKSKKNKNAYGELLDALLDRKKDAKNPEKDSPGIGESGVREKLIGRHVR